jgi:hypothetical protein
MQNGQEIDELHRRELQKRRLRREPLQLYPDSILLGNIISYSKSVIDWPQKYGIYSDDFSEGDPEQQLDLKTEALAKLLFDDFRNYFKEKPEYDFLFFVGALARMVVLIVREYGQEGKLVLDKIAFSIENFAITGLAEIVTKKENEPGIWDTTNLAEVVRDEFQRQLAVISHELNVDLANPHHNNSSMYRLFQPNAVLRREKARNHK